MKKINKSYNHICHGWSLNCNYSLVIKKFISSHKIQHLHIYISYKYVFLDTYIWLSFTLPLVFVSAVDLSCRDDTYNILLLFFLSTFMVISSSISTVFSNIFIWDYRILYAITEWYNLILCSLRKLLVDLNFVKQIFVS